MEKDLTGNKYVMVNITEEIVINKVKEMMATYDMCHCEKCFWDVCALILNNLKPQYVTTRKGSLFSMLSATELQNKTDLTVHVLNALKQVKESPQH